MLSSLWSLIGMEGRNQIQRMGTEDGQKITDLEHLGAFSVNA